jgi:hypothetical protein
VLKKFVIAAALVVGVSTAASAQYYNNNPFSQPQPRTAPPTYIPQQYDPPGQFNPPPPQPGIGNLPAYNNYCMSLGGQLTTNCNR